MLIAGFEFPEDVWVHPEHQVWARLEGDAAVLGITALGIHLAGGEIYMCRPKAVGTDIEQGRSMAVVELAKSIVSVKSPLSGRILETNPRLAEQPEWVHRAPYGDGWLLRLQPSRWPEEAGALAQGDALHTAVQQLAWLNRLADAPGPVPGDA